MVGTKTCVQRQGDLEVHREVLWSWLLRVVRLPHPRVPALRQGGLPITMSAFGSETIGRANGFFQIILV